MNSTVGSKGEDRAAAHLMKNGYRIIARNWRAGRKGELDIICLDGKTLVFVEVKTATGSGFGDPVTWVSARKQKQIASLATTFLAGFEEEYDAVRFDVVSINLSIRPPALNHLVDAFRIM